MFRCVPFTLSILAIVYVQMICLGIGFLIPNYAQLVLHQNAFAAGCLLLPGCVVGAVVSPFSGRLLHRFGAKRPILEGNLAILFATACFGVFALRLSAAMFLVVYIFFAFGQSCSMGNSMTSGLRQLSVELNADGNAVINTTQQLGGAVGTSVVSSILAAAQAQLPGDMVTGTMLGSHTAFLILAALAVAMLYCLLGAVLPHGKARHGQTILCAGGGRPLSGPLSQTENAPQGLALQRVCLLRLWNLCAAHNFIVSFGGEGIYQRIDSAEDQQRAHGAQSKESDIGQGEQQKELADHGKGHQNMQCGHG